MSWERVPFESLYAIPSKNGLTRPARVRGSGYKMINMSELFAHDRIGAIDMELVPMNEKELETMLVDEGDLMFARQSLVLSGAGKCSIVKTVSEETTFESHIIRVRLKKDIAYPNFFFYYFKSPQCGIKSIVTQGVQAGIRGNDLKTLPVALPPMDEQIKIADILVQYDDLIENNRRRIQLLEESARLLYQEWFIHLRFPGHEQVKIIDGVPEGWERSELEGYINFANGKAIKNSEEGIIPVYGANGIIGYENRSLFDSGVVIGRVGAYCGSTILALTKFWGSDNTIIAQPAGERFGLYFLYFMLTKLDLNRFAGGAAQPLLTQTNLKKLVSVFPSQQLCYEFDKFSKDIFSQINTLCEKNKKLAQARDLLLPKLMSGELTV